MEKVTLEIHEDVVAALKKIKETANGGVELVIPEGSVLFENILNLKLLLKEADSLNKPLTFSTIDEIGNNLLDILEGGEASENSDFISREVILPKASELEKPKSKRKLKIKLPTISFSFLKNIKLPKIIIIVVILGLLGLVAVQALWRVPKANISVVVESQPLIKSVEIQVKPGTANDVEGRILAGTIVAASVTDSKSMEPTGQKVIGEKASGKVEILNYKVGVEAEFDEGEELYSKDDDDFKYFLKDDVTVGGATEETQPDLSKIITPGKAEVEIEAADIGKDYNLDKDRDLYFEDHSSNDYAANVIDELDGGSSEIVNVVSQADMDLLSAELFASVQDQGAVAVGGSLASGQVLINGSVAGALATEEFNAKLDEEVEELELKQTVNFQGLSYKKADLDAILEDLLDGFIPDGYELSTEERETNVEILGNTDATVLNLSQADLQVTIKAYVIPEVDEDKLKDELTGISISEAEKILGKVRNVDSYEIKLDPNIPLIGRMPTNKENISLEIKKD